MLRLLTAGESHGPGQTVIIEGLPAGLEINSEEINRDLARRQKGYGRGERMKIETDKAVIRSGVRLGRTMGTPLAFTIDNHDYINWEKSMSPQPPAPDAEVPDISLVRPRPGHADLAGALKFQQKDVRNILERTSARHTAARVAVGSIAKAILSTHGIDVLGHVLAIGSVNANPDTADLANLRKVCEASQVRCADDGASQEMMKLIDSTISQGDSLGGRVEVIATGVPPGLGHFAEWDRRLDARLAQTVMSIPAIKAFEIGDGFLVGTIPGSQAHDEIIYDFETKRYRHTTNHSGGIEGGLSNGERIIVRAVMKPIPTLARPLKSVDLVTHEVVDAGKERTDSVAVPACAVVCEAAVAWVIATAFLERFGGDTIEEVTASYQRYLTGLDQL
ncbi:MAG: chorismate synthase [Deltaproteobacteria bacterium]|nr:chorismate synthase [Deltaproteobacteria bacterium]